MLDKTISEIIKDKDFRFLIKVLLFFVFIPKYFFDKKIAKNKIIENYEALPDECKEIINQFFKENKKTIRIHYDEHLVVLLKRDMVTYTGSDFMLKTSHYRDSYYTVSDNYWSVLKTYIKNKQQYPNQRIK